MKTRSRHLVAISLLAAVAFTTALAGAADPLPSWNDGLAKQSIIAFVEKATRPGSLDFVPVSERIATFDNDGTLWCEKPLPVQLYFVIDRVKACAAASRLADQGTIRLYPEGRPEGLDGRRGTRAHGSDHGHPYGQHDRGIRADREGLDRHREASKTGKHFTDMVYQPMLEVLAYPRKWI